MFPLLQLLGRPGCSVQWGAWGGKGMAIEVPGFIERMARMGLGVLPPTIGLAILGDRLHATWASKPLMSPPVTIGNATMHGVSLL